MIIIHTQPDWLPLHLFNNVQFNAIDTDGDGKIVLHEFKSYFSNKIHNPDV